MACSRGLHGCMARLLGVSYSIGAVLVESGGSACSGKLVIQLLPRL